MKLALLEVESVGAGDFAPRFEIDIAANMYLPPISATQSTFEIQQALRPDIVRPGQSLDSCEARAPSLLQIAGTISKPGSPVACVALGKRVDARNTQTWRIIVNAKTA